MHFFVKRRNDGTCDRENHTPLHLSAAWGLEKTVQCLMEHNADVNAKVILISVFSAYSIFF